MNILRDEHTIDIVLNTSELTPENRATTRASLEVDYRIFVYGGSSSFFLASNGLRLFIPYNAWINLVNAGATSVTLRPDNFIGKDNQPIDFDEKHPRQDYCVRLIKSR